MSLSQDLSLVESLKGLIVLNLSFTQKVKRMFRFHNKFAISLDLFYFFLEVDH